MKISELCPNMIQLMDKATPTELYIMEAGLMRINQEFQLNLNVGEIERRFEETRSLVRTQMLLKVLEPMSREFKGKQP